MESSVMLKIIPFFSYFLFLAIFLDPTHRLEIGFVVVLIGFATITICGSLIKITNTVNRKSESWKPDPETKKMVEKMRGEVFLPVLLFLGSILVFQALYVFTTLNENCDSIWTAMCFGMVEKITDLVYLLASNGTILLASFFAIGVLYYHGCIIVLRSAPFESIGRINRLTFAEDFIVFLEAIVLFFVASSIGSLQQFVIWVFVLMTVDLMWIFFNFRETMKITFHWIHFDFLILLFLIIVSTLSLDEVKHAHIFVLVILTLRTVLDYKLGWKGFWSKYEGKAAT